jgi:hypothetical protein
MKKIYSLCVVLIAAMTMLATTATANPLNKRTNLRTNKGLSIEQLIKKAPQSFDLSSAGVKKVKTPLKFNAGTSVEDICGSYYSVYYYSDDDSWVVYSTPLEIEAGDADGEVILNNFWESGCSVTGTYNAEFGMLTVPKQELFQEDGYSYVLQTYDIDDDNNMSLLDDDFTLYYDDSDNTLFSIDYWCVAAYPTDEEFTEENCEGTIDICQMMVCAPTNGTSTYTMVDEEDEDTDFVENVIVSVEDNVVSVENLGGMGLVVKFDIDETAKTATANNQYFFYVEDAAQNYYPYFLGNEDGSTVVVGQITGDYNNVIYIPEWYLVFNGQVYNQFIEHYITTPFNLLSSGGLQDVNVDNNNAPIEYFNLQGIRVDNPAQGIFIRKQGSSASKVIMK